MGAMKGARIVANELFRVMWSQPDGRKVGPTREVFLNGYASLGDRQRFGGADGSETEIDVLVKQLNLSPQAETMLTLALVFSSHARFSAVQLSGSVKLLPATSENFGQTSAQEATFPVSSPLHVSPFAKFAPSETSIHILYALLAELLSCP